MMVCIRSPRSLRLAGDRWSKCLCEINTAVSGGMAFRSIPGSTRRFETSPIRVVRIGSVRIKRSSIWIRTVECPIHVALSRVPLGTSRLSSF